MSVLQIPGVLQAGLWVIGHRGFIVRVGLLEGVEPLVQFSVKISDDILVCVGEIIRLFRIGLNVVELRRAIRTADVLAPIGSDRSERAVVIVDPVGEVADAFFEEISG